MGFGRGLGLDGCRGCSYPDGDAAGTAAVPGEWAGLWSRFGKWRWMYREVREMGFWADRQLAEERRESLMREAAQQRLARLVREGWPRGGKRDGGIEVRWGLEVDDGRVAELLELNGMPRWVAFEERFIVAERGGQVLAALRYRTEPKRLVLGPVVADPWGGEWALAVTLYAGAVGLAREMGVREILVPETGRGYPGEAGYSRRGGGWRLDSSRLVEEPQQLPARGWRRMLALLGVVAVPFFKAFDR